MAPIDETPGSKTSSPTEPQNKAQIDFQFLNFSHPSEAKASGTRKAVRSHVTRQQHQREHAAAAARRAKTFPQADAEVEEAAVQPVATSPFERPVRLELPGRGVGTASSTEGSSPSPTPSGSASPMYRSETQIDPSDIYPDEWHPYLPRIMVRRGDVGG